jgi:hypothetical protein
MSRKKNLRLLQKYRLRLSEELIIIQPLQVKIFGKDIDFFFKIRYSSKMNENRRKHKRIRIHNLAKINDTSCSVVNVSKDGLLLTSDFETTHKNVEIELKIDGKWVALQAAVVWFITNTVSKAVSMGVFIKKAPQEYRDFIDNLYLEADEEE